MSQVDQKNRIKRWSTSSYGWAGVIVIIAGLGGFVTWAALTEIDGAVIAPGRIEVGDGLKRVQHQQGGIIMAIHVRNGDQVKKGDLVITLDGTELKAQNEILSRQLFQNQARKQRLESELELEAELVFSKDMQATSNSDPALAAVLAEEKSMFGARKQMLFEAKLQLDEQIHQTEAVIAGLSERLSATLRQSSLLKADVKTQEGLLKKGLTENSRVTSYQREAARIEGEAGGLQSDVARAKSAIAGFESQKTRLSLDWRHEAWQELLTIGPQIAELNSRLLVIESQQSRLVLTAPVDGIVLDVQASTIGGVLTPGTPVASIVPSGSPLIIKARVQPKDVDQVQAGQAAVLHFQNLNARMVTKLDGKVVKVSADTMFDPANGQPYFDVELAPNAEAAAQIGLDKMKPGMPVEAFINNAKRTPLSFLIKPLQDYFDHAMKEK